MEGGCVDVDRVERRPMNDVSIDAGIWFGRDECAIAVMPNGGPRVIRLDGVDETMPSAVYISRAGEILVGSRAANAMAVNAPDEGDGYAGLIARIGNGNRFDFPASGKSLSAPELGAIVIGELKRAYETEMGIELEGSVITSPARADEAACEGICLAARRAGLAGYPLIEEPIAAALAHGLCTEHEGEYWMVFHLGSSALDVSLVTVRDGEILVAEDGHARDDTLGDKTFERGLMEYVTRKLSRKHALSRFSPDNPRYAQAWAKLLPAVRRARTELLTKEETTVEVEEVLCEDAHGEPVRVHMPLGRGIYGRIIEADVSKAVRVCHILLAKNRLAPENIGRLVLAGVGSATPFVQESLERRLRIQMDTRLDPKTVVVRGAAMHAASLGVAEPAGPSDRAMGSFAEMPTLRKLPAGAGGVETAPDEPIRPFEDDPVIFRNSCRLALKGGDTFVLIPRGVALPTTGKFTGTLSRPAGAEEGGESVPLLTLLSGVTHLLGGESEREDCCLRVGGLRIPSEIGIYPEGAGSSLPLELDLYLDADRRVHGYGFVPSVQRVFECTFDPETFSLTPSDWAERFLDLKQEIARFDEIADPSEDVAKGLRAIHGSGIVQEIEQVLAHRGDRTHRASYEAYKALLRLAGTLDAMRKL